MKIGYIRISNKDKSSMQQIAALAVENCDRVVEEVSPFAAKDRPELENLMTEMAHGDTLVVWGFERIACSVPDLHNIIGRLHERGITLHALKEKFISNAPEAEPMLRMLGHVAEFKSFNDSERSTAAQRVKKDKGIRNPSTRKLTDRDMQMIFALIEEGIPKTDIAKKFNVSEKTLFKTLRDPRFAGEVIMRPRRNPALKERLKDAKASKHSAPADAD